jgi:hypothetical protein
MSTSKRITAAEIERLACAIERARQEGDAPDMDRRLHEAMIDGMQSQLDDLRHELDEQRG